jgi:hypothetical protein
LINTESQPQRSEPQYDSNGCEIFDVPGCKNAIEREAQRSEHQERTSMEESVKTKQEWTVDRSSEGVSNPMARIMQGETVIIGWTMRPYSESFLKIAAAHNAALTTVHDKFEFRHLRKVEELKLRHQEELTTERKRREQTEEQLQNLTEAHIIQKKIDYEKLLSALAALKELQDERDKDKNLPKV